jgi:hypothetical protein
MSCRPVPASALGAGLMLLLAGSLAIARGFAEAPPQGVDLNGTWTLNVALSDDPKKILEAERARMRGRREPMTMLDAVTGPEGGSGRAGASRGTVRHRMVRPDPAGEIEMPPQVTIGHTGDRFTISTPAPSGEVRKSEYRAGSKSVVSVATGVADRHVGWKGKSFIISTRAVEGVNREERYSLEKDGRLLVVTETRGEDIPKREIKRLYDRATQ